MIQVTAKGAIVAKLLEANKALAVHEFGIIGYSENAIATRLSEMARQGYVIGEKRPGKQFKEWRIVRDGIEPTLTFTPQK